MKFIDLYGCALNLFLKLSNIPCFLTGYKEYIGSESSIDDSFKKAIKSVDKLGTSSYIIYQKIAIYICAICVIGSGITLVVKANDAKKRGVAKDGIIFRLAIGVLIMSGTGFLTLLSGIRIF